MQLKAKDGNIHAASNGNIHAASIHVSQYETTMEMQKNSFIVFENVY